jgi:ComF family protein
VRRLLNWALSATATISRGLFAAFFPSDCRLCDAPLVNISRLPVCQTCILSMHPISGETCDLCGERLPQLQRLSDIQTCSACQETRPSFGRATAYGAYQDELRELIHLLKYDRVLPAAGVLGAMLAEAIEKLDLGRDPVLVVPVPLHISKRRQRGFNQSELVVRAALKKCGKANSQLATDLLVRQRPTISQIGLTRPQRAENIRGAFRVAHPSRVVGRTILLVDDVLTTGTTASECARVLRKAGAKIVMVATVARTLKEADAVLQVEPELEPTAQVS